MIEFLIALFKTWITRKVDPQPVPTPTPQPTPKPTPEPEPQVTETPTAAALHDAVWGTEGATQIRRESGQVNNPNSSRGRLKFIVSGKRAGTIARVYCFKMDFRDTLKRETPNESGNRQRYYGSHAPANYPKDLIIRIDINENGVAKDVYYILADPTKREG
jgi:hypothetical protein